MTVAKEFGETTVLNLYNDLPLTRTINVDATCEHCSNGAKKENSADNWHKRHIKPLADEHSCCFDDLDSEIQLRAYANDHN